MTTVTFTKRGIVYSIRFRYDALIVDTIKTVVPHYCRSWDPIAKQWTIEAIFAPLLADEMRRLGHHVVGIDDRRDDHHRDRDHGGDSHHWARAVFQRVGPTRAPLAYRLLSKLCHPDHGGTHELQLELNAAYAELPTQRRTA